MVDAGELPESDAEALAAAGTLIRRLVEGVRSTVQDERSFPLDAVEAIDGVARELEQATGAELRTFLLATALAITTRQSPQA
jgi:hypothetical protein